ncbi:MAG: sigma-70 family RNA polymerase sigma factor [Nibricoccus sp.]
MSAENVDSALWFADEVQVHKETLRVWLERKFPAATDLDDIVQEALTRVWRARVNGSVPSPKALLFTVANNLTLDQLRRRQIISMEPIEESDESFVYEKSRTPAEATAHNQELELLTQAIQSLPDRCRQVLTLRKIYGLPQKEIARQLGISEHTVEAQIANGMRRCAEYFARFNLP